MSRFSRVVLATLFAGGGLVAVAAAPASAGTASQSTLTLIVRTIGGEGTFDYSGSGFADFTLSTESESMYDDTKAFALPSGNVLIQQDNAEGSEGFVLRDVYCEDADDSEYEGANWLDSDPDFFVPLAPNHQVRCVITNIVGPAVTIDKWAGGDADLSQFIFTVTPVSFDDEAVDEGWYIARDDLTLLGEPVLTGSDPSEAEAIFGDGSIAEDALIGSLPYDTESEATAYFLIEEAQVPGWILNWVDCYGEYYTYDTDNGVVVGVNASTLVQCEFDNNGIAPDLELVKTTNPGPHVAGGLVEYRFTITNVGGSFDNFQQPSAEDEPETYSLDDELPAGQTWNAVPEGCTGTGTAILSCELPLDALSNSGDSVTVSVWATIAPDVASGRYDNMAYISWYRHDEPCAWEWENWAEAEVSAVSEDCTLLPCGALDPRDDNFESLAYSANPANNVSCAAIDVIRAAAVTLAKTDNAGAGVTPGASFTYTLQAANTGPSSVLAGSRLVDDLPDGLTLTSINAGSGWTCNNADPVVCDYANGIAPGANATPVTITVSLSASYASSSITNVATFTAPYDVEAAVPTAEAAGDLITAAVSATRVTPVTQAEATTTSQATTTTAAGASPTPPGTLPELGSSTGWLTTMAALLLALGGVVLITRRRRTV
ncbi:MAG TPA: hypothetical protein PLV68_04520 [Ilumatobacteraceae bacterium]|nr:hypothetical protein [Ilumatobacteraceae bacterium]